MHRTITTVLATTTQGAVDAIRRTGTSSTWIEVRLDGLWHDVPDAERATDDLIAMLDAARVPLLACLRPARQGGLYLGAEDVRIGLLVAAAQVGYQAVDLELDVAMPAVVREIEKAGATVMASLHAQGEPPCRSDVERHFAQLRDGAAIQKLAFPCDSFLDQLKTLEMVRAERAKGGHPIVAPLGTPAEIRALLGLIGNEATYGGAPGAAAPGQPALADVQAVWHRWGLDESALDDGGALRPWYAVLGAPVDRSLSPRMHNAAFLAAGRPERYGALHVPDSPGTFRLVCHAAGRIGLAGASVTYPHKTTAAQLAECDAVAKAVGAANQIRFVGNRLEATNTDATALRRLLQPHIDSATSVMVLGAGGAARAAIWAAKDLGAKVTVAARDATRARAAIGLADAFSPWSELPHARADVWVQATTLGLTDPAVSPATPHGARAVVEMNYKSGPTRFERDARAAGAAVVDGRQLVLEQAIDAWRYWTGAEPDTGAMRRAIA